MTRRYQIVGLMSGSSLDGLDVACVDFEITNEDPGSLKWNLVVAETVPLALDWVQRLQELPNASALQFCKTHADLGHYFGILTKNFIQNNQLSPDYIASHGHTVFHYPKDGFTVQIGDGAAIAAETGIAVISDFRTKDVALGGQGAPLAPLADKYILPGNDFYVNLGGIANISCNIHGKFIAFDTSAANQVLNHLANTLGFSYDDKGKLAAKGQIDDLLLQKVNENAYYQQHYPKSLDNGWVQKNVLPIYQQSELAINDQLATAVEQTAQQLAAAVKTIIENEAFIQPSYKMVVTGGGVFNEYLIQRIKDQLLLLNLDQVELTVPDQDMIQYKEAILMALVGLFRVENLTNSMSTVTGASRDNINGAIYLAK